MPPIPTDYYNRSRALALQAKAHVTTWRAACCVLRRGALQFRQICRLVTLATQLTQVPQPYLGPTK